MNAGEPHRRCGRRAIALVLVVLGCVPMPARNRPGRALDGHRLLAAEPVRIESGSGSTLHAWLARGRPGAGAVILLHGIGSSHLAMLDRASFLVAAGYSVLLLDFRGHGESGKARSTYGGLESGDARAAVDFVRAHMPGERLGVIGVSMGGAAALLGPRPLGVEALVLESVYPTIGSAVRNRLSTWLGPLGVLIAPVVVRTLFPREGVTARDLRPVDRIGEQHAPTFVLAGADDPYTTLPESEVLFEHAHAPKQFWAVPRAAHVDLHAVAGEEYERRVGTFLARYLRSEEPAGSRIAGSVPNRVPPP